MIKRCTSATECVHPRQQLSREAAAACLQHHGECDGMAPGRSKSCAYFFVSSSASPTLRSAKAEPPSQGCAVNDNKGTGAYSSVLQRCWRHSRLKKLSIVISIAIYVYGVDSFKRDPGRNMICPAAALLLWTLERHR